MTSQVWVNRVVDALGETVSLPKRWSHLTRVAERPPEGYVELENCAGFIAACYRGKRRMDRRRA